MSTPADDAMQALAYLDHMLVTQHTDFDAGTLHYSTAAALARQHPDQYVIDRIGRQRRIRRLAEPEPMSELDRLRAIAGHNAELEQLAGERDQLARAIPWEYLQANLVTQAAVSRRLRVTRTAVTGWAKLSDWPAPVMTFDSHTGKGESAFYWWPDIEAWCAAHHAEAGRGMPRGRPRKTAPQAGPLMGQPARDSEDRLHLVAGLIAAHEEETGKLTAERDTLIRQLGTAGLSYREIGALADVSHVTAGRIIKDA